MASSFFVSPFERAALLSIDGFGDFVSTMWGVGCGNKIEVEDWVEFPHSMGILYTAITQYLGFPKYGDEFKVMGLAPYGEPEYLDRLRKLVRVKPNGGFRARPLVLRSPQRRRQHDVGQRRARPSATSSRPSSNGSSAAAPAWTNRSRRTITTSRRRCRRCSKKSCSACCEASRKRPGSRTLSRRRRARSIAR